MEHKRNNLDNTVLIGSKPFMNYVTAVVIQFAKKESKKVTILARGKFITTAVDVAEVSRRKFLVEQNATIGDVRIASEEFKNKEGKKVNVSAIEIDLIKGE